MLTKAHLGETLFLERKKAGPRLPWKLNELPTMENRSAYLLIKLRSPSLPDKQCIPHTQTQTHTQLERLSAQSCCRDDKLTRHNVSCCPWLMTAHHTQPLHTVTTIHRMTFCRCGHNCLRAVWGETYIVGITPESLFWQSQTPCVPQL